MGRPDQTALLVLAAVVGARAGALASLLLPPVARHPALAPGFAGFLARPLVRRALLVRRLASLARDLPLFGAVHRCESAILFCHRSFLHPDSSLCSSVLRREPTCSGTEHGCNRCA